MNPQVIAVSPSTNQSCSKKWRIGGVLSSAISPALLSLTMRSSRIKRFPLRPAVIAAELPVRLLA